MKFLEVDERIISGIIELLHWESCSLCIMQYNLIKGTRNTGIVRKASSLKQIYMIVPRRVQRFLPIVDLACKPILYVKKQGRIRTVPILAMNTRCRWIDIDILHTLAPVAPTRIEAWQ